MFYDGKTNKWTSIASMIEYREKSACTVFEGKITISGGFRTERIPNGVNPDGSINYSLTYHYKGIKSIEAYDHNIGKWFYLPNMLSARNRHSAVSIGNKLFMIGGNSEYSEVFDSVTRKFTYVKTLPKWVRTSELDYYDFGKNQVVSIGNEIYFLQKEDKKFNVYSYYVRNNHFCYKTSFEIGNFKKVSCIKVPMT